MERRERRMRAGVPCRVCMRGRWRSLECVARGGQRVVLDLRVCLCAPCWSLGNALIACCLRDCLISHLAPGPQFRAAPSRRRRPPLRQSSARATRHCYSTTSRPHDHCSCYSTGDGMREAPMVIVVPAGGPSIDLLIGSSSSSREADSDIASDRTAGFGEISESTASRNSRASYTSSASRTSHMSTMSRVSSVSVSENGVSENDSQPSEPPGPTTSAGSHQRRRWAGLPRHLVGRLRGAGGARSGTPTASESTSYASRWATWRARFSQSRSPHGSTLQVQPGGAHAHDHTLHTLPSVSERSEEATSARTSSATIGHTSSRFSARARR